MNTSMLNQTIKKFRKSMTEEINYEFIKSKKSFASEKKEKLKYQKSKSNALNETGSSQSLE